MCCSFVCVLHYTRAPHGTLARANTRPQKATKKTNKSQEYIPRPTIYTPTPTPAPTPTHSATHNGTRVRHASRLHYAAAVAATRLGQVGAGAVQVITEVRTPPQRLRVTHPLRVRSSLEGDEQFNNARVAVKSVSRQFRLLIWRSSQVNRFRLPICTYDAPPWGVRVGGVSTSRKIPAPRPLLFTAL